jgi:peptide/nickel transport system permease protein
MVLSLKNQEFTDAARSLGASNGRIILRHMVPNSMAPVIVAATLGVGGIVVLEAALSYLGFGVKPPAPSWGNMLQDTQRAMFDNPFEVFYPGMAIFLTSLSFNFIGDALRDALDPRLKM